MKKSKWLRAQANGFLKRLLIFYEDKESTSYIHIFAFIVLIPNCLNFRILAIPMYSNYNIYIII